MWESPVFQFCHTSPLHATLLMEFAWTLGDLGPIRRGQTLPAQSCPAPASTLIDFRTPSSGPQSREDKVSITGSELSLPKLIFNPEKEGTSFFGILPLISPYPNAASLSLSILLAFSLGQ